VFHEVSPLAGLGVVAMLNERGYRPAECQRKSEPGANFGVDAI
jgi:hypothetical protein